MKKLFIDVETQGLDPSKHGVWQVSGSIDVPGKLNIPFEFILNPPENFVWEDKAFEMYKNTVFKRGEYILESEISYQEFHVQFTEILSAYVDKFNKIDKYFLVAYNGPFDDKFLRQIFNFCEDQYYGSLIVWPPIDVAVLAAHHLGDEWLNMPSHKLFAVAEKLGLTVDQSRLHDASYDIALTREIFYLL